MPPEPPRGAGDWLDECVGFVVTADAGRIGRLEEVVHDSASGGRPAALVVRAGLAGSRRVLVSPDDVVGVLLGSQRILLDSSWVPLPEDRAA